MFDLHAFCLFFPPLLLITSSMNAFNRFPFNNIRGGFGQARTSSFIKYTLRIGSSVSKSIGIRSCRKATTLVPGKSSDDRSFFLLLFFLFFPISSLLQTCDILEHNYTLISEIWNDFQLTPRPLNAKIREKRVFTIKIPGYSN